MIKLTRLASPRDKKQLFEAFDPSRQTWVVADAESKRELQNQLLLKNGFIEDESVLRANEVWCFLLKRVRPDFEIVSGDLARVIIAEFMKEREYSWAKTPGAAHMACRYVKYLMPLLSHPHGREAVGEWFRENPDAFNRWGHWFQESHEIWSRFARSKMISIEWAPGLLVNHDSFNEVWTRELIFDVGPCLQSIEAELLSRLASDFDVNVIEPAPSWRVDFQKNFAGYSFLAALEDIDVEEIRVERETKPVRATYLKMTTMLAEVKQAVSTAREWLERGVEARDIAVIAPNINRYWPVLRPYLREEGIPVRRKWSAPLSSFPEIARWLSRLKIAIGELTKGGLETVLFQGDGEPAIPYQNFKILFGVIYGDEDLERSEQVYKMMLNSRLSATELLSRDQFVAWALTFWSEPNSFDRLHDLMKNFMPTGPASLKLPAAGWVEHLAETSVQDHAGVTLKEADAGGITLADLNESEQVFSTHTILIGMTESALRRDETVSILPKDLQSLTQSLGFNLPVLEDSRAEFSARWLFEDEDREFVVTAPLSDFSGGVETPSLIWLSGAAERGDPSVVSVPGATRWDELQSGRVEEIVRHREWHEERRQRVQLSIEQDRGERDFLQFGGDLVRSLSASGFEDYLNCPFVFAAKRLFKLSDQPSVDLDIDHMTKGKLVHALFEELTKDPMNFHWSDRDLEAVIEKCREREEIILGDKKMWTAMRRRYVLIAKRFLEFERAWRTRFPKTNTAGRELDVKGVITPLAELVKEGEGLTFRGSIDRLDIDRDGHAVIIDYKSTKGAAVVHHGKWLENNVLQLLLYAMAIESGLSPLGPLEVIGALYFVVRDLTREHGFMLQEYDGILFETKKRMGHGLSSEEKRALFDSAREKLKGVYSEIKKGMMHPHPFDQDECRICQWRTVCRAPHLL